MLLRVDRAAPSEDVDEDVVPVGAEIAGELLAAAAVEVHGVVVGAHARAVAVAPDVVGADVEVLPVDDEVVAAVDAARGLEVTVLIDEKAFEGTGAFLLGAILERFFAEYVAMNNFTQTVIRSVERGEIMRWPVRLGNRRPL